MFIYIIYDNNRALLIRLFQLLFVVGLEESSWGWVTRWIFDFPLHHFVIVIGRCARHFEIYLYHTKLSFLFQIVKTEIAFINVPLFAYISLHWHLTVYCWRFNFHIWWSEIVIFYFFIKIFCDRPYTLFLHNYLLIIIYKSKAKLHKM